MTALVVHETVPIPASHLDLLTRPICGVLTTMGGEDQPQSSVVWVNVDGKCACVNTTLERQKAGNVLANPKVSLLVVDPDDTGASSRCGARPSSSLTARSITSTP